MSEDGDCAAGSLDPPPRSRIPFFESADIIQGICSNYFFDLLLKNEVNSLLYLKFSLIFLGFAPLQISCMPSEIKSIYFFLFEILYSLFPHGRTAYNSAQ